MKRRSLILATGAWAALCAGGAQTQQRPLKKIALLMPTSTEPHFWDALKTELAKLGYLEGRDVVYESRSAEGRFERLPALAEELVRWRPDLIVAASTPPVLAAKAATKTIPIVIATAGDPVKSGAVASFSRPGGNVTGISNMAGETTAKTLELARSMLPTARRVAVLRHPDQPSHAVNMGNAKTAAAGLGLTVLELQARAPSEIDTAFANLAKDGAGALFVLSDPFLVSQREKLAELARAQRVAVFSQMTEFAQAGALMSYGPDFVRDFRRAASFVDRILKGAKPGELPIEQAASFALVINRKTAAALGLTIPPSLLVQATEVIE